MSTFSPEILSNGHQIQTFPYPDEHVVEQPPYSSVVRAGDYIYVAGVLGLLPGKSELVPGGVSAEARQALTYINEYIEMAGGSLESTFKCMVLLSDINDFPAMNVVWSSFFPENPPARSTLIVKEIPKGAAIEIDCNAMVTD